MNKCLNNEEQSAIERYWEETDKGLFAITKKISRIRVNQGPRIEIETEGNLISYLVDTGSPVNVVDEDTYSKMSRRSNLDICEAKYTVSKANCVPPEGRG